MYFLLTITKKKEPKEGKIEGGSSLGAKINIILKNKETEKEGKRGGKRENERVISKTKLEIGLSLQRILNWDVLHLNTRVEY